MEGGNTANRKGAAAGVDTSNHSCGLPPTGRYKENLSGGLSAPATVSGAAPAGRPSMPREVTFAKAIARSLPMMSEEKSNGSMATAHWQATKLLQTSVCIESRTTPAKRSPATP
mmetsp:Transcript_41529/g.130016  ORF Transcript_41529/g.130016 Transcript_41529/m.130016 type:complete len:114 (-) Transcript_41529:638-979(-)